MHIFATKRPVSLLMNGKAATVFEKVEVLADVVISTVHPTNFVQELNMRSCTAYGRDENTGILIYITGLANMADLVSHLPVGKKINLVGVSGTFFHKKHGLQRKFTVTGLPDFDLSFPSEEPPAMGEAAAVRPEYADQYADDDPFGDDIRTF